MKYRHFTVQPRKPLDPNPVSLYDKEVLRLICVKSNIKNKYLSKRAFYAKVSRHLRFQTLSHAFRE